ncbi:MAG: hypothetical protein JXD22_16970 [Sedimentisphaerales bacterium]|nr:hypothetical protein [Sedimentisphaerales bacterium]
MLTLIKRESQSLCLYLALPVLVSIFIAILLCLDITRRHQFSPYSPISNSMYEFFWVIAFILPPLCVGVGLYQMLTDHYQKISPFLLTHATTRSRIFLARITIGIIAVLILSLFWLALFAFLIYKYPRYLPGALEFFMPRLILLTILNLTCYSLGILIGLYRNKLIALTAGLLLPYILISLIAIKGFTLTPVILLLLITAAATIRTWQKFLTQPL